MGDEKDNDDLADIDFSPAGDDAKKDSNEQGISFDAELEEMTISQSDESDLTQNKNAADLEAVFDVPVRVSVVLGRTKLPISQLLGMDVGTVVELDRQVGEAIDIHVNDRLVARGEIVLVEDRLGVTMTEIIKAS